MSSLDDLLTTSTIAGNGNWDETYPFIEKKIVLDPNTIIVREGTEVKWSAEREGYLPKSGELIAKDFRHDITVILKKYVTFTIEVTFTAIGGDTSLPEILLTGENGINLTETKLSPKSTETIIVAQRSIDVPEGNYVSYVVNKNGYNTKRGNYRVNATTTLPITLNDNAYTFTVNPTPHDADVLIVAERPLSQQIGNSILVEGKPNSSSGSTTSTITYTVSKEGYETISSTLPYITSDTSINVTIKQFFSVQITVTDPTDAEIKITNIIGAKPWEPQKYYDVHALVTYENKFYNCTRNHTSSMSFEPEYWTEVKNSAWVIDGYTVQYEVKRVGYREIKSSILVKKNENISIRMESTGGFCSEWTDTDLFCLENNTSVAFQSEASTDANLLRYTLTINPAPLDSTVELDWNGEKYYKNVLQNVVDGDYVRYIVQKENYVTEEDEVLVANNITKNVSLELEKRTLSITPTPSDANVTLTCAGYEQNGNTIIVHHGNTVQWNIERKHWMGKSGSITMTEDTILPVELDEREQYTITVNITPSQNTTLTLTADGYEPVTSNNGTASITVDSETMINWTASHAGYDNKSGTIQALKTETVNYSMTPGAHTYTIVPYPSDATVTLTASGYTQAGNSITVYGEVPVTYTVSRNGLATQSGTKTITSNVTDNITLHYPSGKVIFESATSPSAASKGTYQLYIEVPGNYYIQLVGGGGNGVNNYWWHASGGSGAYVYGTKYLQPGNYTIVVGGIGSRDDTSFNGEIAGGGERGYANLDGTRGGYGGTATTTLNYVNGNNGQFCNGTNATGAASVYNGYGKGYGNASGAGTAGYAKNTAV